MTLLAKLRTAAAVNATLQALLGTAPFRWYDQQLVQGTAFPAVAAFVVSQVPDYSMTSLLISRLYRLQINVYDPDPEVARGVASAIVNFFPGFNAYSATTPTANRPNRVVNIRDGGIVNTDPLTAKQLIDVMVWNNESI